MKTAEEILIEMEKETLLDIEPFNWDYVIRAMEEYKNQFLRAPITDQEIEKEAKELYPIEGVFDVELARQRFAYSEGAKWYRSQIKLKIADR